MAIPTRFCAISLSLVDRSDLAAAARSRIVWLGERNFWSELACIFCMSVGVGDAGLSVNLLWTLEKPICYRRRARYVSIQARHARAVSRRRLTETASNTLAIEMIETISRRQDAYPLIASTPEMVSDRVQGIEMKNSRVAICSRYDMPKYGQRLANLPLKKLRWEGTNGVRDNLTSDLRNGLLAGCVGDLSPDDQLVIPSCSRAYLANLRGTRCQVSLWLREPPIIHGRFYRTAKWWHKRFKHVLTFDQPLIDQIPNAVFIPHGGCWLNPIPTAEQLAVSKTHGISLIVSPKRDTEGQRLRHEVVLWASNHGSPMDAFGKLYRSLPEKSEALLPYRYSIVIENSQSSNYFTEKLIDCMLCNCLPIYWGTADVKHYFDPSGILFCESFEEICDTIATLAPDDYQSRLAAIQRNREIALSYASAERIIFETLGQPTHPTSVAYHRVSNEAASQPLSSVRVP